MFAKLLFRAAPFLLMVAGAILSAGGLAGLFRRAESVPTVASIEEIEAGKAPQAEWLKVSGGHLYWPGAVQDVAHHSGGWSEVEAVYVPLVSQSVAQEWDAAGSPRQRSAGRCKLMVRLKKDVISAKFPFAAQGIAPHSTDPFEPDGLSTAAGTVVPERISSVAHGLWAAGTLDLSNMTLLEHDTRPLQKGEAGLVLAVGLATVVGGLLLGRWMRVRRRRQQQIASAVAAGVRSGFDKAISDVVGGAVRNALAQHAPPRATSQSALQ